MKVYLIKGLGLYDEGGSDYVHSVYLNEDNAEKKCEELNKKEKAEEYPWYIYAILEMEVADAEQ